MIIKTFNAVCLFIKLLNPSGWCAIQTVAGLDITNESFLAYSSINFQSVYLEFIKKSYWNHEMVMYLVVQIIIKWKCYNKINLRFKYVCIYISLFMLVSSPLILHKWQGFSSILFNQLRSQKVIEGINASLTKKNTF